ncbi:MAG TPA: hypothetical protein VME23_05420 [Terracidiphilus sp.]|nr:hypothetical protein [Terracidiphilus sp.]
MRRVLLDTWDPIGIQDEPNAQDEYDAYIGDIFDLLVAGAPDSKILDYLFWAAHEHMGLDSSRREDMLPTVAELRKIGISPIDNSQDPHL